MKMSKESIPENFREIISKCCVSNSESNQNY